MSAVGENVLEDVVSECPAGPKAAPPSKDVFHQTRISRRREILYSQIGLGVTLVATAMLAWQLASNIAQDVAAHHVVGVIEQAFFSLVAVCLIYGNLVYQLTRIGYMRRLQAHKPAGADRFDQFYLNGAPRLTVLIPSYKEDPQVVRRSLLSAALQDYPDKRIVLLIDDSPRPTDAGDRRQLEAARELSKSLQDLLAPAQRESAFRLQTFLDRQLSGPLDAMYETLELGEAFAAAAQWFEDQAVADEPGSHSEELFVRETLLQPAEALRQRAHELQSLVRDGGPYPRPEQMLADYRRLAGRFDATLTHFERKKYLNFSHEANKAMNLNSYIALLGKQLKETIVPQGLLLEPCANGSDEKADLEVPASDYLITLDADSLLAPQYAMRLIEFAERPANARFAVVQTPYSAEPNPPGVVERIAGATTDIQYLIHQGFTHFNATFWVGANALLRVSALREISAVEEERGYRVMRFIQDRTVIEDTESSVDLAARGWKLYNYPERLSHSATPADFGALLIQRRRWANGGLIILPKLLRYLFSRTSVKAGAAEGFLRLHYLASIAMVNLAVPLMLFYPFERNLRSIWFPLSCLPYFLFYGRDLVHAGYRLTDLLRVYALNLLLIPVNLGGVFKSIQQGLTRRKIPFGRTPKVANRTAAPAGYVLAPCAMLAYCLVGLAFDALALRWAHAAFDLMNGLLLSYAVVAFIGWRGGWEDVSRHLFSNRKKTGVISPAVGT